MERPTENTIKLDRVHRVAGPRNPPANRPRDVLCRVQYYCIREDILRTTWRMGWVEWDGAKVTILPDISKITLAMQRIAKPLLHHIKTHGETYIWGHPFDIRVRKEGKFFSMIEFGSAASSVYIPWRWSY